jgi:eukaryotic-like serine/threonine-protein kinase
LERSAPTPPRDGQELLPLSSEIHNLAKALADKYVIEREIGRGGMATVYLARDLRHDRKVALKVLDPELAAVLGVERFLSEIRVTANLQHPNLLPLFDSGGAEGRLFYVMPFVEGESLRARLDRDKQLPIDDALQIAASVASALDYAHQHGVVHRDLKPENILIHGGQAVVADFGIALAVSKAGGTRVTQTGISLGTPQYMSPEQATGDRVVDGRSDIYSLAAVTYEMLTGEPPHTGATSQSIIAKLLTEDVRPIRMLRRTVPPHVEDAVQQGLQKLPADRFATANEFARALGVAAHAGYRPTSVTYRMRRRTQSMTLIACGAFVAGAIVVGLTLRTREKTTAAVERYLNIVLPDSLPVAVSGDDAPLGIWQRSIAISNDGRVIAYVAHKSGGNLLVVRRLDDGRVTEVPGSNGAFSPFFSPDGEWIAFFDGSDLKKVSVGGGQPVTLATDLILPVGGVWPSPERIAITSNEGTELVWFSSAGGKPERIDSLGSDWFLFPQLLPGGKEAVAHGREGGLKLIQFDPLKVFDITTNGLVATGEQTNPILGHNPVYSKSGHLVYASLGDGGLMALPFDAKSLQVLGAPALVLDRVRKEQTYEAGQFAIAGDGTLAYVAGGNGDFGSLALVNVNDGRVDTLPHPRAKYRQLHIALNAERVYVRIVDETGASKQVALEVKTSRHEDLNVRAFPNSRVVVRVLDDGKVFVSDRQKGSTSIVSLETGAEQLIDSSASQRGFGWPDLATARDFIVRGSAADKLTLHYLGGDTTTLAFADDGYHARIAPDGRWMAYTRRATATVAVSPIPPTGVVHQVSLGRAEQPHWSASGKSLYYRHGRRIWKADVSTTNGFRVDSVRQVLDAPLIRVYGWSYDVTRDGRLLVVLGSPEISIPSLNVITGFGNRLNRLAPRK